MIPIRIALTGFMSYRETQELFFDGAPLWVLTGENGAGKSAVFDAITLVLFDTFRGRQQHLEDLINQSCDRMEVEFDFSVSADLYRVRAIYARKNPRKTRLAFRLQPGKDGEDSKEIPLAEESKSEANYDRWIKHLIGLDYHSFTASILLMQGYSDKLLQVPPEKRRAILASLIDISRYEQLAGLADGHHNRHKTSMERFQKSFAETSLVSDEQLEDALREEQAARDKQKEAQEEVDRLSNLLTKARDWERLNEELQKEKESLEHVSNLLEREQEIRDGYSRLIQVNMILPGLEEIVKLKGRLSDCTQELQKQDVERQRFEKAVESAQQEADSAQKKVDGLQKKASRLMKDILKYTNRLSELAPLAERLSQVEAAEEDLNNHRRKLQEFDADLDKQVEKAQEDVENSSAARSALPWLKKIRSAREKLAKAEKNRGELEDQLDELRKEHEAAHQKSTEVLTKLQELQSQKPALVNEVTVLETRLSGLQKQKNLFIEEADKAICSLCRQPISPEHVQKELERFQDAIMSLDDDLVGAKSDLENLEASINEAQTNYQKFNSEETELQQKVGTTDEDLRSENNSIQLSTRELNESWKNLSRDYQQKISPEIPRSVTAWQETTYPSDSELKQESDASAALEANQKEHRRLQDLQAKRNEEARLENNASRQLEKLLKGVDIEAARQAKDEKDRVSELKRDAEQEHEQAVESQENGEQNLVAKKTLEQNLRSELENLRNEIAGLNSRREEINRQAESQLSRLPDDWQAQEDAITAEAVAELKEKQKTLQEYDGLCQELAGARASKKEIERHISGLKTSLIDIPEEAHCSAQSIQSQLKSAQELSRQQEIAASDASKAVGRLEEAQKNRKDLEKQKLEEERLSLLYKQLATLLGKNGLQKRILSRAEEAIVELANRVLDGLSHGRSRLALRPERKTTKALDLIAYDKETTRSGIPIDQTSGSQRFRIAISLALAIGQYTRRESRRIESVIIDEGFGSLDKTGQENAIKELQNLQMQLSRIILVSHQEEFYSPFTNRYEIQLVDGASRASIWDG